MVFGLLFISKPLKVNKTRAIRKYYEFLKCSVPKIVNLHLKGEHYKIISGITDFKELETLYQSFPPEGGQVPHHTNRDKRNKIILGLLVYQAINTEELSKLETYHVKLKEGKIYIPGNRRRNSRTLELKPFQILELHEYLTEIRSQILAEIKKPKPFGRKPDKINMTRLKDQLFISVNGSENIKHSLLHLFGAIRKKHPAITNAVLVRQSEITHWLKTMNLRQVQYMAGHKHVSSTERYKLNNLDNLQSKLEKYHPLNNNR
jgi:integrase/recombinase XerD